MYANHVCVIITQCTIADLFIDDKNRVGLRVGLSTIKPWTTIMAPPTTFHFPTDPMPLHSYTRAVMLGAEAPHFDRRRLSPLEILVTK